MGNSRIIVVANQKGGAGKSTLCMLLANWIVGRLQRTVGAVIDTDPQQSIIKKREEDLARIEGTDKFTSYQTVAFSLSNLKAIPVFIERLRKTNLVYIIDTPGSLGDDGIASFLALADFIICPFDYDKLTLKSTTEFLIFWCRLKDRIKQQSGFEIKTKMIMTPCGKPKQVGTNKEKELWTLVADGFAKYAEISPEIPDSSAIRNCDTIAITQKQEEVAGEALAYITDIIFNHVNNDSEHD